MAKKQAIQEQRDRNEFIRSRQWDDPNWIRKHKFAGYTPVEIMTVLDDIGYFQTGMPIALGGGAA